MGMYRILLAASLILAFCIGPLHAEGMNKTRESLDDAQLLIRNDQGAEAHKILWEILLNGE